MRVQLLQCYSLCRLLEYPGHLLHPSLRSLDVHYLCAVEYYSLCSSAACADLTGRNATYDVSKSQGSYAAKNLNPCKWRNANSNASPKVLTRRNRAVLTMAHDQVLLGQYRGHLLHPSLRSLDVHYLCAVESYRLCSSAACADLTGRNATYDVSKSQGSYAAKNLNPCKWRNANSNASPKVLTHRNRAVLTMAHDQVLLGQQCRYFRF